MQVILLQDVKAQGKKGDVIKVSDGYAKNFLFPKGLAKEATKHSMNELQGQKDAAQHKINIEQQKAQNIAERMKDITVVIKAKAGENGKLFGSVTTKDIAAELSKQFKIDIDKRKLDLPEGIKTLGVTEVKAHLFTKIIGIFKVNVLDEE